MIYTKEEWQAWARYCAILVLLGLLVVVVSCRVLQPPKPPAKVPYPPGLVVGSNRVQRLTAQPQAAVVAPSQPLQDFIQWEEPENAEIAGYIVSGSRTSSTNLTVIWSGPRTNRAPARDFLYFEIRPFSTDLDQRGLPAIAMRPSVVRSNAVLAKTNTFIITFVPAYWRTNLQAGTISGLSVLRCTNVVEWTKDFTNWFQVQRVFGANRTNVVDRTTDAVRFYRVRAL